MWRLQSLSKETHTVSWSGFTHGTFHMHGGCVSEWMRRAPQNSLQLWKGLASWPPFYLFIFDFIALSIVHSHSQSKPVTKAPSPRLHTPGCIHSPSLQALRATSGFQAHFFLVCAQSRLTSLCKNREIFGNPATVRLIECFICDCAPPEPPSPSTTPQLASKHRQATMLTCTKGSALETED